MAKTKKVFDPRSFRPRSREDVRLIDSAVKRYGSLTEAVLHGLKLAMEEDELSDKLLVSLISKRLGVTPR